MGELNQRPDRPDQPGPATAGRPAERAPTLREVMREAHGTSGHSTEAPPADSGERIVRVHVSEIELPEEEEELYGGPVEWVRDAMDRNLNPNAIDHREIIQIDRPPLPPQAFHHDKPKVDGSAGQKIDPPLWGDDGPRREDVRQGVLGDCWALSAIGAVAGHHPERIKELMRQDLDGYTVRLQHARRDEKTGDWIPTDNRVHMVLTADVPHRDTERDQQAGTSIRDTGVAWASVLEKALAGVDQAWAPLRDRLTHDPARGYDRMVGGSEPQIAEVLTQVSGERAGVIEIDRGPGWQQRTEDLLRDQLEAGHSVIIGTRSRDGGKLGHGLYPQHAYEVTKMEAGLVHLRNPWGDRHPSPMSVTDLARDSRGKIVTTASDEARNRYLHG